MLLSEINPFIRYANQFIASTSRKYLIAKDCRMYFVVEAGENDYLYIDTSVYKLQKNAFAFFPHNTPYKFKIEGGKTKVLALNFDFSRNNSKVVLPIVTKTIDNLNEPNYFDSNEKIDDVEILNQHIFLENGYFSFEPLTRIKKIFTKSDPLYFEEASTLLKHTIIKSVIYHNKAKLLSMPDYKKASDLVEKIKQIIQSNYTEELTNEIIARQLDYHAHHLNRVFQKIEGISIHKYLIIYRIIMAEKLLLETNNSITEIAMSVGFNSTTRFAENFKAKNKLSPAKYRHFYREN